MEKRVDLVFEDGSLLTAIITSENLEGLQVKMFFGQKSPDRDISLLYFKHVGEYFPQGDPDWIPQRLFKPAIRQARAIFNKYQKKEKLNQQARLIS